MRYLVYLLTLFFIGTAIAQSPTIVQGDYITNVFGPSNFVKNPNAQINTANVTVSNATVTRATTTPLVAKSEFTITTSTATGYADWDLRAFDAGMKNNNCEARFTYRGFTVGSTKAQILQGANVVAELTLVGDANNPKQASINFPCGDLSAVTKFRLQQATASLTGTNEIGGIYVGLATNMANVAQATRVGGWKDIKCSAEAQLTTGIDFATPNVAGTCTGTADGLANLSSSNLNTLTLAFTNLPPGDYLLMMPAYVYPSGGTGGSYRCDGRIKETTLTLYDNSNAINANINSALTGVGQINQFKFNNAITANRTFQIEFKRSSTAHNCSGGFLETNNNISLYRFPSSSELVVTPERQNVWGAVQFTGGSADLTNTNLGSWIKYSDAVAANFTAFGSASSSKTSCTYGSGAAVGANDVAICMPVITPGTYKVTLQTRMLATTATADCNYRFTDGLQTFGMLNVSNTSNNTLIGIVKYNALTLNRGITVESFNNASGGACNLLIASTSFNRTPQFIFEPLDQPTNSALYVQGPVLGAQTGAAISSGYVGQTLMAKQTSAISLTTASWKEITTLTLTPGVWQITGTGYWDRNFAAMTAYNIACAFAGSITDLNTNYSTGDWRAIRSSQEITTSVSSDYVSFNIRPFIVRNDGTNLYYSDGVTFASSSQVVRLFCYSGSFSAGAPRGFGLIEAIRLN